MSLAETRQSHPLSHARTPAGIRINECDWRQSDLGPISQWPAELCAAANLALDSALACLVTWGEKDTICALNDSGRRLLEVRPEPLGLPLLDVWADVAEQLKPIVRAVKSGESQYLEEYRSSWANQPERYYNISMAPLRDSDGHIAGMFISAAEVTRSVEMRSSFAAQQAKLAALIDVSSQLTWETDSAGLIVHMSEAWLKFTGQTAEEAAKSGWVKALHPDHQEKAMSAWQRAVRTGHDYDAEYPLMDAEGSWRWTRARAAPIRDQNGQIRSWIGINLDINHLKRAELELEQALSEKENFLATLSHELRNPLAAIVSGLNTLEWRADPVQIELTATHSLMRRQLEHLVRLVDDLLDMSRMIRGQLQLKVAAVDLVEIIHTAVNDVRHLMNDRDTHFSARLPEHSIPLTGDAVRLNQVFTNLLHNAIKYSGYSGNVVLELTERPNWVEVTVSDDGVGLNEDMLSNVFNMFGLVNPNSVESGLGVGLALAKNLVNRHGGSIVAQSDGLDCGASFTVRLPLDDGVAQLMQAPVPSPVEDDADESLRSLDILLVEDDADVAESMAGVLDLLEQKVRVASTGQMALDMFFEQAPELVILDIGLPDMSGNDVARLMRQSPEAGPVIFAALTGWGGVNTEHLLESSYFDYRLTKPLDIGDLEKMLQEVSDET